MATRVPRIIQAHKVLKKSFGDVPKGHLAVYVGESQKKLYVIPISYLSHPLFQGFLCHAEQEFGFDHPMGGLTFSCPEDVFIDLISRLSTK